VGVKAQLPVLEAPEAVRLEVVQVSPVPSLTVTVPDGATVAPMDVFVTVKLTVTACPTTALPLVGLSEVMVVEVLAAVTV
jgi:hypothetical protein